MSITGVLGRGWGSPTDGSGIDPRNNGKDRPDQAKDASSSGSTKELRRSETKADGVLGTELCLRSRLRKSSPYFPCANLKEKLADEPYSHAVREFMVDDKLQFMEEPVEIMEQEIKQLKQSRIPLVKVCWNSRRAPDFTGATRGSLKKEYHISSQIGLRHLLPGLNA
ncbi:hypothetical protein Tco_0571374 [Tanacetum coccineum]